MVNPNPLSMMTFQFWKINRTFEISLKGISLQLSDSNHNVNCEKSFCELFLGEVSFEVTLISLVTTSACQCFRAQRLYIKSRRARSASSLLTARGLSQLQNSMRHKSFHKYIFLVSTNNVMEHFSFPGNIDFAAYDQSLDVFIHRLWNKVYYRWITNTFPCKWNTSTAGAKPRPGRFSTETRLERERRLQI